MSRRQIDERSIRRLDTRFGREFDRILNRIIADRGLDFFTDEQIAELRAGMVIAERDRQRFAQEQRRRSAA